MTWRSTLILSVSLLACGNTERNYVAAGGGGSGGASSGGSSGSAGNSSGGGGAGGTPAVRCDPSAAFDPPAFVPTLSSDDDIDAGLTWDGLKIVVWRAASGAGGTGPTPALYSATRPSLDAAFGTPEEDLLLKPAGDFLGQSQEVDVPSFSGDGLAMYAHFGGQGYDHIYASTRSTTADAFEAPIQVDSLKDTVRRAPFASFDGRTLYFSQGDIYSAAIAASGAGGAGGAPSFAAPTPHNQLNTATSIESYPVVSQDEKTIYFSSDRAGGQGGDDIWRADFDSATQDFGAPQPVNELNSGNTEHPIWLSPNNCEIYMVRQEGTVTHVLVAKRSP